MPIPVQLYNSLVPVQLCRTTTTTRVLYRSTTTVPVRILLGKLYSVQPYSRTRTLTLRRSQKVTKTTVFVCWNFFLRNRVGTALQHGPDWSATQQRPAHTTRTPEPIAQPLSLFHDKNQGSDSDSTTFLFI